MGYKNTRTSARSKSIISTEDHEDNTTTASTKQLVYATETRQLFVLPYNRGTATVPVLPDNSKFLSLRHPATRRHTRFYIDETHGLVSEFTRIGISPVSNGFKSWMITTSEHGSSASSSNEPSTSSIPSTNHLHPFSTIDGGYTLKTPNIFIATPFDPVFFLIPLIPVSFEAEKGVFRIFDDYLEQISKDSPELWHLVLRSEPLRKLLQNRMEAISDSRQAGGDKVYRPSFDKFLHVVIQKAKRASSPTRWPKSMEREHIKRKIDDTILPTHSQNLAHAEGIDVSSGNTTEDLLGRNLEAKPTGDDVKNLQRIYVSAKFLVYSYVPSSHRENLLESIYSNSEVDFNPLKEHLASIEAKKAERQALHEVPMNNLNKRALEEVDDEIRAIQEAKRRRKEEDERKKTVVESRGIRDLKKADTSGMKKLSSFFTAKTPQLKNSKSMP